MAIDWSYNAPVNDALDRFGAGFDQGRAISQDRERRSAVSAYLPGALQGDRAAAGKLAAVDPDLAVKLHTMYQGQDETARKRSLENWDWIGSALVKQDGSPIGPEDLPRVQMLAKARGLPAELVDQVTPDQIPQLIQMSEAARTYQRQAGQDSLNRRVAEANIRQSDAAAAASGRSGRGGAVDPNTGVRVAPAGVQGRDHAQLKAFGEQADAAARAAAVLRSIEPNLNASAWAQGPGFGARRNTAGVLSVIPGVTAAERYLTGQSQTQNTIDNYDAIEQASKEIGIAKLTEIGGSDTERELMTAIKTTVNPDASSAENERRFNNQLAASDILAQKGDLATKWVGKFGSLMYPAPDGTTWQGFWSQYQKAAWADHRREAPSARRDYRGEQRGLLNQGNVPQGAPPPPPGTVVR